MGLTKTEKETIVAQYGRKEGDTGSPEVQIALLTQRIHQLTDHLRQHIHDQGSRRGLVALVGQRRSHLKYLNKTNPESYQEILQKLGIRR